jgi:hypothetical protein
MTAALCLTLQYMRNGLLKLTHSTTPSWSTQVRSAPVAAVSSARLCSQQLIQAYRPDKSLLLATSGSSECGNMGHQVCSARATGEHNDNCIGRLTAHGKQLYSASSPQHQWVQEAHSFGLVIHAWTIRNEVCVHL